MVTQAARRLALPCLKGPEYNTQDLRVRRQQCHQLADARAEQIEWEVRNGLVDLSTARRRGELAQQRSQLAFASVEQRTISIELDRAVPGSDLLVNLEMLAAEGDRVQNQIDEGVAWVRLDQAQGIAAELP
jgi:hypothetical protein